MSAEKPAVDSDSDIQQRLAAIEQKVATALARLEQVADFAWIDKATGNLGERAIHQNFNQNYLGKRFSNYELMLCPLKAGPL